MNTLRSQILLAVTAVMLIASAVIMYSVYTDTYNTVEAIEKKSIENILDFMKLNLEDNYNYLLQSKHEHIKNYKDKLKNNVLLSLNVYSSVMESVSSTLISFSKNKKKTDKIFLDGIDQRLITMLRILFNSPQRDKTLEWMLIDKEGNVSLSTDDSLEGKNIGSFYDFSGHNFAERYHGASLSRAGQFAVFSPQKGNGAESWKLGYFTPLSDVSSAVASFVDIKSLFEREKYIMDDIVLSIKTISSGIKVGKTGFIFICNGKKEMIIHPLSEGYTSFFKKNSCIDKVIETNKESDKTTFVPCLHQSNPLKYLAYTRYFKGFDWYVSVILPSSEIEISSKDLVEKICYVVLIIFIISVIFFTYLVSRYTKPLAILSLKLQKIHKHDFTDGDHSELIDGLPLAANNEIGRLAETFSYMIEKLSNSIKRLVETTANNERIESELNIARDIQLGTLPTVFSFEPERKALDIHAYLIPAREIGGDLYDFFFINEDHLCFSVGDVAGKGVPAALFMVIAKKLISSNAHKSGMANLSPAEIMGQINEMLCKDNTSSTFITLFIGILNVKSGELLYANGGHVPPIFVDCGGEPKYRKELSGPVVGVMPGIPYKDISTALQPGGAVFLCTDGVTEAMNEKDELFGDKRLLDEFSRIKDKACKEVVNGILYEVRTHAGKAPQSDDIAMLMVRWGVNEETDINYISQKE